MSKTIMKNHSGSNIHDHGLPSRIVLARRSAGLSQTALAAHAEVTASAVAQWEHPARTQPALHHLLRIAEVTGVGLEWLLTGKGRRNQYRMPPSIERPAVSLDTYAQDAYEETLLSRFRELSARRRDLLLALLEELSTRKAQTKKKAPLKRPAV